MMPLPGLAQAEVASLHSITSSARAASVGGISSPKALAVCRLTTNSNLVLDRQVGRLGSFENSPGVDPDLPIYLGNIGPVAHQPARLGPFARLKDRGNAVPCCQRDDLDHPAGEYRIGTHEESTDFPPCHFGEGAIDLVAVDGVKYFDFAADRRRGIPQLGCRGPGTRIVRMEEHRDAAGSGRKLMQQAQALRSERYHEVVDAGRVASRPIE